MDDSLYNTQKDIDRYIDIAHGTSNIDTDRKSCIYIGIYHCIYLY